MTDESPREHIKKKARTLVAKLTEQFAKTIIAPHKDLEAHTLVIETHWETDGEETIKAAIERCKARASSKQDSKLSKLFFGVLRFMGFGYIEPTGEGSVDYEKSTTGDGESDNCFTITTKIGVRLEAADSLAAMSERLSSKLRAMPRGVVCSMTGVPAKKAKLVDMKVEVV